MVCIFAVNLGAIAQKMHLVGHENATRFSLKNSTTIEKDPIFPFLLGQMRPDAKIQPIIGSHAFSTSSSVIFDHDSTRILRASARSNSSRLCSIIFSARMRCALCLRLPNSRRSSGCHWSVWPAGMKDKPISCSWARSHTAACRCDA